MPSTSPETSRPSQTQKQNTFSLSERLTPSEIESLRQDRIEADKVSSAFFREKYADFRKKHGIVLPNE